MSSGSSIEWTECTWNPVTGCSAVSEGCRNCYAVKQTYRLEQMGQRAKYGGLTVLGSNGRHFTGEVRCHEDALLIPLGWKKPRRIFVNSMSDLFHPGVPFDFVDKVFAVMALTPQHTYQVLTKRPERMAEWCARPGIAENIAWAANHEIMERSHCGESVSWPLPNVWLGTSVENQDAANERIPHLRKCPAAVRFLSCEPLLGYIVALYFGPIDAPRSPEWPGPPPYKRDISWVIVGGESGPNARPCNLSWIRSIVEQCQAAGVACFVKQLGKVAAGGKGKGGDMEDWPEELRVREWPHGAGTEARSQ